MQRMVFLCKITIGDLIFESISEVDGEKTWRKYTGTANIKFPKAVEYRFGNMVFPIDSLKDLIKTGDAVKIELGYNKVLVTEFEGYVSQIQPTIPIEINCEDEMFKMKRNNVSINIEDATVRQILEAAAPGYEIACADEKYGDFSYVNTTSAKVFEELKKKAGLYTFFRGKRLVCGLPYSDVKVSEVIPNFVFGKNIIDNSLIYKSPEDCNLKIYGKSIQNDGTIVTFDKGNEGGDIQRINYDYQITKKELEEIVNKRYDNAKTKGGYAGSITSYGFPIVEHGQRVRIYDPGIYEKRDTTNFVDTVKFSASMSSGYRRECEIGKFATEKKLLK